MASMADSRSSAGARAVAWIRDCWVSFQLSFVPTTMSLELITRIVRSWLYATLLLIRPLKLYVVGGDLLKTPRANVTDLSIRIVVPASSGYRVGDCLAQFMRTSRS